MIQSRKSPAQPTRRALLVASAITALCISQAAVAQTPQPGGAAWAKTVESAKAEGRVMIYSTALPSVHERLSADFANAYPGVRLEFTRLIGFNLNSKVEQEGSSGADGADGVIVTDMLWLDRNSKAGTFIKAAGPAAATWPERYMIAGTAPIIAMEPYAIAYNTSLVTFPVTGYQDFVKPGVNLKMATLGPVAPIVLAWYDWLDQTQGPNFLKEMAARKPFIHVSNAATTQAAASGEVAVAISSNPASASALIAQGAPIKVVVPNPTMGIVYGLATVRWSKRPNASQLAMDYLMSPRGQTVWNGLGESASPLKDIKGSLNIETITPWDAAKFTPEVIKAHTERWNALFKQN